MRIKPPVTNEQAYQYLSINAALVWGLDEASRMDSHLSAIAQSMAVISAIEVPEDVEPLFGEDIGLDEEFTS